MLKSFRQFLSYCRSIEGEVLYTGVRSKPFYVQLEGNALFRPQSLGKRRRADSEKTERVLSLLSDSKDWSAGSYEAITYHASYIS